ncbi:MAG: D-tyrosyl-tRNA(Tyr) deacylase, partial [Endomicrobium sp.]|nr:D-tyrosyl-tRNA(Tyr) deacylase [Endomicrobium sp.]
MKTVLQRVKKAAITINGQERREIGEGLVVLAGFGKEDNSETIGKTFDKIKNLRIFSNAEGKFDLSISDIKGELLIVSQFTLYGDCKKGKRPDFSSAAPFEQGKTLYEEFIKTAKQSNLKVKTGEFGADMLVEIHNDGPVTIILNNDNSNDNGNGFSQGAQVDIMAK